MGKKNPTIQQHATIHMSIFIDRYIERLMGILLCLETTRAHPILWLHNRAVEAFFMKRGIASMARNPLTTTQWPQNKNLPRTLVADILSRNVPRRKARSPHFSKRLRSIGQVLIHRGICWCCGSCPSGYTIAFPSLPKGPFERKLCPWALLMIPLRVRGSNHMVISKDIHRLSHRQSLRRNATLSQTVFGNIAALTWGFLCLR